VSFIDATGNVPVCDPRKLFECVKRAEARYVADSEAEKCNCRRPCRYLSYHPTISQSLLANSVATYLSQKHPDDKPGTPKDLINDHCIVEVGIFTELYICMHTDVTSNKLMSTDFARLCA